MTQFEGEKNILNIIIRDSENEIRKHENKIKEAKSLFLKEYAMFWKGTQIIIKYPNSSSPKEKLEIINVVYDYDYNSKPDIIYTCKKIVYRRNGNRAKKEVIWNLSHGIALESEITFITNSINPNK